MSEALTSIPLSQLQPAKANARRTHARSDIKELAASIAAHGLLQNLTVRPAPSGDGAAPARYEVVAGGRRLAALKLLVKRKQMAPDAPVPCSVLDAENDAALEASLAENVVRAPLHPADQFEAFARLAKDGHGHEAIAARFGVSPATVRQRLKLAAVSPKLMRAYREEAMTLDQLMAFAISDDHAAQEHVWFDDPLAEHTPRGIRRALTRTLVAGGDRRARFVGAEAYEAAGGTIRRDLFDAESAGYFEDSKLLDRLVAEKLAAEAEQVQAEGWAWVEARVEADYEMLARLRRIPPKQKPLPKKEQKKLEKLCARHDVLIEQLEDDADEVETAELDRISAEIDRLSARMVHWERDDMTRAGALLCLDPAGAITVTRGLVRPEDEVSAREPDDDAEADSVAQSADRPAHAGYPEALLVTFAAHKTAALQAMLADAPEAALTALLHTLVLRVFFGSYGDACVDVRPGVIHAGEYGEGAGESAAAAALAERHAEWAERMPAPDQLWDWLAGLDRDRRLALLAYCTARCVNALYRRWGDAHSERDEQAEALAESLALDMTAWWQPTRESCLDRFTKQQIVEAVSEAKSRQAGENIAAMKKPAMAARAEELLAGTGWLPAPLRRRAAGTEET